MKIGDIGSPKPQTFDDLIQDALYILKELSKEECDLIYWAIKLDAIELGALKMAFRLLNEAEKDESAKSKQKE